MSNPSDLQSQWMTSPREAGSLTRANPSSKLETFQ